MTKQTIDALKAGQAFKREPKGRTTWVKDSNELVIATDCYLIHKAKKKLVPNDWDELQPGTEVFTTNR